jgi:hypothetical protein
MVKQQQIDPLYNKNICFIYGLSPHRAVNILHVRCKKQSVNVV